MFLLILERGREREKRIETSIMRENLDQLPLLCPPLGTELATQACALTRNRTMTSWFIGSNIFNTHVHGALQEKKSHKIVRFENLYTILMRQGEKGCSRPLRGE